VDAKKDFKPAERKKLADGLERPYGLAFWKGYLYNREETSVKRYKYDAKNMSLGKGEEVVSLAGLGGGHWTRSLLFDSKGENCTWGWARDRMFQRAKTPGAPRSTVTIRRQRHETYVSGTRNPSGCTGNPGTNTLWAAVQKRDLLGDDLVAGLLPLTSSRAVSMAGRMLTRAS